MSAPIFLDADNHPLPADYNPDAIEQCDDCGCDIAARALTGTIAGFLCPACYARFIGAARGLVQACQRYVQRKAGKS